MAFSLISSQVLPASIALAQQFVNMEASPTERDVKQSRTNMLRDKAEAGQLVTFNWATCSLKNGNAHLVPDLDAKLAGATLEELLAFQTQGVIDVYRTNGQHSSLVMAHLEERLLSGVMVSLSNYLGETLDDVIANYRQQDSRESARSAMDIANAYQGGVEALADVNKTIAKRGCEGAAWYLDNVEGASPGKGDDRYALMNRPLVSEFLLWLSSVFATPTREMQKQGTIAAMYGTWVRNREVAEEFWKAVAIGGVDDNGDTAASTLLALWLRRVDEMSPADKVRHKFDKLTPGNYFNAGIYAWNAHLSGVGIREIKATGPRANPRGLLEISGNAD